MLFENPHEEYSTPMVAPITTDSGTDANWHNTPVTVTLTCADVNGSGCKTTYYTIDGTEPTTSSSMGNSIVLNTDGIHTIKYFSIDKAGNVESVKTAANPVKIDMTAPGKVSLTSPANEAVASGNPQQKWGSIADAHHYEYESYNNSVPTGPAIYTTNVNGTTRTVGGNQNIIFWWRVRAVDTAGNKGEWSDLWKLTVDNINPTSTHDLNDAVAGEITITQQITDNNPKSGKLRIWKLVGGVQDNSQFFAIGDVNVDSEGKITYNLDTVNDLFGDGEYVAKFTATDLAGNQSLVQKNFVVDNTKPTSTITNYNLANGGSIETNEFTGLIEGTASDALSGINHVLLSISHLDFGADESETEYWDATNSAWVNTESMFMATGTESWNYQLSDVPNGIYNIASHAVDNVGNVESTYRIRIVYDKTIPEVILAINPASPDGENGWYRYTNPTITLTASDNYNLDHIEYQWNSTGGSWTIYANPFNAPSEGQSILYYRSIDSVNNVSDVGIKEVKFDKTNPAGEPLEVKVENVTSNTADATWKKPTDDSDVSHYRLSWRHENGTEYSAETGKDDFAHQLDKLFNGLWTLSIKAVDSAGNFTEKKVDFRVGPGPSAGGTSTEGSVLGTTTGFGTGGTAPFITQTTAEEDEETAANTQGTTTESNPTEGAVLGTSTCNGVESYLPIILLVAQLLVLLAVEVLNREAGFGKFMASVAITIAVIPLYFLLRNTECFAQGTGLDVVNNWFAGIALVTGIAAKLIGKAVFEEK